MKSSTHFSTEKHTKNGIEIPLDRYKSFFELWDWDVIWYSSNVWIGILFGIGTLVGAAGILVWPTAGIGILNIPELKL